MVAGDSIARNLATGLRAWQDAGAPIQVYDASINGCPISRGGVRHIEGGYTWPVKQSCGWWGTSVLDDLLAQFDPDIVLVNSSHDEMYDRSSPSFSGVHGPGDPVFDDFLTSEWRAAADRFRSTGATLVWTTSPCVQSDLWDPRLDSAEANRRSDYFNAHYIPDLAAAGPVDIADFDAVLCPTGEFSTTVMGVEGARADGFHLTDEAAAVVAERWLGPYLLGVAGR